MFARQLMVTWQVPFMHILLHQGAKHRHMETHSYGSKTKCATLDDAGHDSFRKRDARHKSTGCAQTRLIAKRLIVPHHPLHQRPRREASRCAASNSCIRTIAWSTRAHRHSINNPRSSRHAVLIDRTHSCPPIAPSTNTPTPSANPGISNIDARIDLSIRRGVADRGRPLVSARAKLQSVPS